jgi:hypothetical protein
MRQLLLLISLIFLSSHSMAAGYLNDASMKKINLNGIKILNTAGEDTLGYRFGAMRSQTEEVKDIIVSESGADALSRVWGLLDRSSFKNILVYVTKGNQGYVLNVLYWNNSGSAFLVDYDIKKADKKSLTVENGPSDAIETLKVVGSGTLF